MTEDFPRLLVATEFPPNASGGGPAIVRQMLRSWPAEKLFWWSCFAGDAGQFGQTVKAHQIAYIPRRLYPHRRYRALKSWLLEQFWTPWSASHLHKTIDKFKPDVIWCIAHGWSIPPLGMVLPSSEIAFHVSIHDYADANSCIFRFGLQRARKMAATADQLYTTATTRDAISESMVVDLRSRTGRDGNLARAGLEPDDFDYLECKTHDATPQIRIAYAGTIIAEKTFAVFVEAMKRVRSQISTAISLEFFSAHSYRTHQWFDSSWMREHGLVSEAALAEALKHFTWGFAPMSLTDDDPRYNRFSLPTKFVSYLAAGLPVITFGHPESTLVKVAQSYGIGLCLTSAEPSVIEKALLTTLSIEDPWARFGSEIQRCGYAEFDAERIRKRLYESFSHCAQRSHHK
jgi:glycosyltransferase involved in cell wall biosynthesis